MDAPQNREWNVERTKVFSLDRCFKCLNTLNLGARTLCTVTVRRSVARETDKA